MDNIILFDGTCNFCDKTVQFILKKDKNKIFMFASLQSDFGQNILRNNNLKTNDFDTFVYIYKGKVYIKSTAALMVLKHLGGFWSILYAFIIVPKLIRNKVYMIISKSRYSIFGKKTSCLIPSIELKKRFIQ